MRRALLIGIDGYADQDPEPGLRLEAPLHDVANLRDALILVGYEPENIQTALSSTGLALTTSTIRRLIKQYLQRAESDDELLIYFSGHGADQDGHRILIPADYFRDDPQPTSALVGDQWIYNVARTSPALSVLVIIDACREGVRLQLADDDVGKGLSWSSGEAADQGPTVAIYYSSQPGTVSWASGGRAPASYFTSALCAVLRTNEKVATLLDLAEAVEAQLPKLLPPDKSQHPFLDERYHVPGRGGPPLDLIIKEDEAARLRQKLGTSKWVRQLEKSNYWEYLKENAFGLALQVAVFALRSEELTERTDHSLPCNRWRSDEAIARFLAALDQLIKPELIGPASVALCITAVYSYEVALGGLTLRLQETDSLVEQPPPVAANSPAALPSRAWRQSLVQEDDWARRRDHLRMVGKEDVADDLLVWQMLSFGHRAGELWAYSEGSQPGATGWLNDIYEKYFAIAPLEEIASDNRVGEVLEGRRIIRLTRLLFAEPEDIEGETSKSYNSLRQDLAFGAGKALWRVDEVTISHLLALAGEMALDPRRLPSVIPEHLGLDDESNLSALHDELKRARWQLKGESLVLSLATRFPSVHSALSIITLRLERHRGRVIASERTPKAIAEALPVSISESDLLPEVDAQGRPLFDRQHLRFTLDQQRIVGLLMGEALYGNPTLALRELYQNALDACRYRRARESFIALASRPVSGSIPYKGRIVLRAGSQGGRPVISCEDDGIGMEERHLRDLFARAGRRFTDSHEFHLDQAQWQDAGISFWPNSRFGIGVLSYFMLAEEIEVQTRRVEQDGNVAVEGLTVRVTGSGSLFRISKDRSAKKGGGTCVTLFPKNTRLNADELLRSVLDWLWLPEVEVTLVWLSGKRQVLVPGQPTSTCTEHFGDLIPVPTSANTLGEPRVFWQSKYLAEKVLRVRPAFMMVDGIKVDTARAPRGLAVNLTEERAGELSVDRNRMTLPDSFDEWLVGCLTADSSRSLLTRGGIRSEALADIAQLQPLAMIDLDRKIRKKFPEIGSQALDYPCGSMDLSCGLGLNVSDEMLREAIGGNLKNMPARIPVFAKIRMLELEAHCDSLPPILRSWAAFARSQSPFEELELAPQLACANKTKLTISGLLTTSRDLGTDLRSLEDALPPLKELGILQFAPEALEQIIDNEAELRSFLQDEDTRNYREGISCATVLLAAIKDSVSPAVVAERIGPLEELGIVETDLQRFTALTDPLDERIRALVTGDYHEKITDTVPVGKLMAAVRSWETDLDETIEILRPLIRLDMIKLSELELRSIIPHADKVVVILSRDNDGVAPFLSHISLYAIMRAEGDSAALIEELMPFHQVGLMTFEPSEAKRIPFDDIHMRRLLGARTDKITLSQIADFVDRASFETARLIPLLEPLARAGVLDLDLALLRSLELTHYRRLSILFDTIDLDWGYGRSADSRVRFPLELDKPALLRIAYELTAFGENPSGVLEPLVKSGVIIANMDVLNGLSYSPLTGALVSYVTPDENGQPRLDPLNLALLAHAKGMEVSSFTLSLRELALMDVDVGAALDFAGFTVSGDAQTSPVAAET